MKIFHLSIAMMFFVVGRALRYPKRFSPSVRQQLDHIKLHSQHAHGNSYCANWSSFRKGSSLCASKLAELAITPSKSTSSMSKSKGGQLVFVGGKGGVGKTSSAGAIAVAMNDKGFKTLVVSTDPAHSLGDALALDLIPGQVTTIPMTENLWALEIDVQKALGSFKDTLTGLDSASLAESFGVPKNIIDSLGLDDLASIFTDPPPGIDEIVALTEIFQLAGVGARSGEAPKYDRIIIDTAPTGHTLRLLQLPDFLNSLVGKLIKFRAKLTTAIDAFKGLFGGGGKDGAKGVSKLESALNKLEDLQASMSAMKQTLKDSEKTQFVVVSIPTQLAVLESERLVKSLQKEGITVSTVVCNQVLADEADQTYVKTRANQQERCVQSLSLSLERSQASASAAGSTAAPIEVTKVPYVDTEVRGVYGLRFFKNLAHPAKPKSPTNPMDSRKITIYGGKGGVGKTTSAASWALQLSDAGCRTLVVSSDPAHSLSDALQEPLSGVPRLIDRSSDSGGQLWAMEIDPQLALAEFQELAKSAMSSGDSPGDGEGKSRSGDAMGGFMGSMGLPDVKKDLADMLLGVENPPPGTDEIVALSKVINYLDNGFVMPDGSKVKFERVVLDTAPTGHTLRMLQLPAFLIKLVKKLKTVRDKTDALGDMFGGGGGGSEYDDIFNDFDSAIAGDDSGTKSTSGVKVDRLNEFEERMYRLEALLHNPAEAEFTVVTIPTDLAVAESTRLLSTLAKERILVRRVIVNQMLSTFDIPPPAISSVAGEEAAVTVDAAVELEVAESKKKEEEKATASSKAYLDRLRSGQKTSIGQLEALAKGVGVELVKVPYFDMEVRSVFGLRVIGNYLFPSITPVDGDEGKHNS